MTIGISLVFLLILGLGYLLFDFWRKVTSTGRDAGMTRICLISVTLRESLPKTSYLSRTISLLGFLLSIIGLDICIGESARICLLRVTCRK